MKLEELIKNKYGSIDSMLNNTDQISRAYIYQLIQGFKNNPTKDILKELSRLLEISLEEVVELLESNEAEEV
jgi:transcriptional regulator with XRE-family HTH domain